MKIKEFDVKVDIKNKMDQEPFEVVQGDNNSNVLNISLVDGLEPFDLTGTEVDIVFEKADSTTVQQTDNAIVNESQGKIRCVLKTNTIACPGKVVAEVRVMESDVLLTSARFQFFVRGSLLNDKTIISTNEFPILSQLIVEANNLIERAEQIEERVPDAVMDALYGLSDSVLGLQNSIIGQIVNDPNKINNAAVIYSLAQQLSTLNNNLANKSTIALSGQFTVPASGNKTITLPVNSYYAGLLYIRGYRSASSTFLTQKIYAVLGGLITQLALSNGSAGGITYSATISSTSSQVTLTITNSEAVEITCNVSLLNLFAV